MVQPEPFPAMPTAGGRLAARTGTYDQDCGMVCEQLESSTGCPGGLEEFGTVPGPGSGIPER
jgi:hypothetical protein